MTYHAHVYFLSEETLAARLFAEAAKRQRAFRFHEIYERPVGPHPRPMVELHFLESTLEAAREWLAANRGGFSVLVHQDTGDDVRDHTEGIEWFGKPLPIDFNFFKLIQEHPELKVHPDRP